MKPTIYRGFQITPVFNYTNGKSDVEYYRLSDPEDSGIVTGATLTYMKKIIDERLEERPETYYVMPSNYRQSVITGLLEALNYCHYWNGQLIADFRNM